MRTERTCRAVSTVALITVLAIVTTACSSGGSATRTSSPGSPTTGSTTSVVTPTTVADGSVRLTQADDGRTVTVHRGSVVTISLASTYWEVLAPGPGLTALGPPVVTPRLSGCVPGGGCGTVTARFRATSAGTTHLGATRTSCGEALRCDPAQGRWRVTVTVVP